SGLYIDAVCKGVDEIPGPDPFLRSRLNQQQASEGLESLLAQLNILDPDCYRVIDRKNPARVIRAIEICLLSGGRKVSDLRTSKPKTRDFDILMIGLSRNREELYERIDRRTDRMMQEGFLEECSKLLIYKKLTPFKTIGYRELFQHLEGLVSLEEAVRNIKTNTRRYAKKQLTWFRKNPEMHWFHPDDENEILHQIEVFIKG
ncbi:MAG: tRNA (adenosine(37)-N6)-dimethylallyltransferase MiaA, partial [Bacteroidetes bacterium]|nr:tRNA (adenosine(37)-N6)-dimethylallyltransferase MiaA [Bacteroidota bacterium]